MDVNYLDIDDVTVVFFLILLGQKCTPDCIHLGAFFRLLIMMIHYC